MTGLMRLISHIYSFLARLYPQDFRTEFGSELQAVFDQAVSKAAGQGRFPLVVFCLRELRDWPAGLAYQHWYSLMYRRKESIMEQELAISQESVKPAPTPDEGPASWAATLAGVAPFILFGLGSILGEAPREWAIFETLRTIGYGGIFLGYLFIMLGLLVGWVRGFPRWVFPYLIYGMIFALYMTRAATPGLRLFGHSFFGGEVWGWRAWIPLMATVALALVLTRFSLKPLFNLFLGVWGDWTCLSFGLYGLLPFVVWIGFDEVENSYQFPFMLVTSIILVAGALAYLRSSTTRGRALALLVGTALTVAVVMGATSVYWQKHDIVKGMRVAVDNPVQIDLIARGMFIGVVVISGIMFAPALLGVLRWSLGRMRPA